MTLIRHYLAGTENLVDISIARLKEFEPPEGYYGAFSGGKDSCVIKHLTKLAGVKVDWHYNWTTVDPPELLNFIREHHKDVEIHKPKESMWQLIVKHKILPTRIMRYCCSELKEGGGSGRRVLTGIRWGESNNRSKRKMFEAQRTDKTKYLLHPIIEWSDSEVWEFIRLYDLPYCSLYDEGKKRIGCIMCPMSTSRKQDAKRWPKHYRAYERACQKIIDNLKNTDKPSKYKSGKAMMDWWMANNKKSKSEEGCLFLYEN